jgi:TonB family protein
MGWIALLTLVAAALLHAALLLLPVPHHRTPLPALSLATDFPLVWRPAVVITSPPSSPTHETPAPPPPVVPEKVASKESLYRLDRAPMTEPLPEPPPELSLASISADVEAIIPNPDTPPPSPEIGPPLGAVAGNAIEPIEQVRPVFPLAARSILDEGRVTLRLLVLPDGSVGHATVEECSRPGLGFEDAALAAVKRWRYEPSPATAGPRKISVTVHFQQKGGSR